MKNLKIMKKIFFILMVLFIFSPFLVFATSHNLIPDSVDEVFGDDIDCPSGQTLCDIADEIRIIAIGIIILLMIVATVVFIWGVLKYILAGGSEQRKKEGQSMIMWGLIGLFILVAMWGLVIILENTFGIEEENIPRLPGQIDF